MNDLQKELNEANVDWQKIKEILMGIANALEAVANMVPVGLIKNLLLGVAAGIKMVIGLLPSVSLEKPNG